MTTEAHEIIALNAVAHILAHDDLRDRFMALTGLDADNLRSGIDNHETLASALDFLISFEPDLIDAAAAQGLPPEELVKAWRALGGGKGQEW